MEPATKLTYKGATLTSKMLATTDFTPPTPLQNDQTATLIDMNSMIGATTEKAIGEARSPQRTSDESLQPTATQLKQHEELAMSDSGVATPYKRMELNITGVFGLDEVTTSKETSSLRRENFASVQKGITACMKEDLGLVPVYIPSSTAVARSQIMASSGYATSAHILMFIADSGPLGLWHLDPQDGDRSPTTAHPYSMLKYLIAAHEQDYGIIVCNPFKNTVKVIEEDDEHPRTVAIPGSSTPDEHVAQVWECLLFQCRGIVSVIAYGHGCSLLKSMLQKHEATVRSKIVRIALIESDHSMSKQDSAGVRGLLGKRAINWLASDLDVGAQVIDAQIRLGCICLSIGKNGTLDTAINVIFSFLEANPDLPGMSSIVDYVRFTISRSQSNPCSWENSYKGFMIPFVQDADQRSQPVREREIEHKVDNVNNKNVYIPRRQMGAGAEAMSPKLKLTPKDFQNLKVVGEGAFGKVFLVQKINEPNANRHYAMKVVKKKFILQNGGAQKAMAERHILTEMTHPFIVKLHYAFQTDSKLYLVMDYLSGGPLSYYLRQKTKFPEEWARFYGAEVAAAIAQLHSVDVMYRDIKLDNVLMDHQGHIRIADFGLSRLGMNSLQRATSLCGTPTHIAPEVWRGDPYGKAADWWSFGILMYEMICGKPPYYHKNHEMLRETILKKEWVTFSPEFSATAVQFIRKLLERDPLKRLGSGEGGSDEVLTHPFFATIEWEALLAKRVPPPFDPGVGELDTTFVSPKLANVPPLDRENSLSAPPVPGDLFHGYSFAEPSSTEASAPDLI